MAEIFKGWRRKLGLLTLVMACVSTCQWIRSERISDQVIRYGNITYSILSQDGFMVFDRRTPLVLSDTKARRDAKIAKLNERIQYVSDRSILPFGVECIFRSIRIEKDRRLPLDENIVRTNRDWFSGYEVEWQRDWGGFAFGAGRGKWDHLELVIIPYWSIVMPFTLLSAYLLLTKPCKSTQNKIAEPVPIDGT